MIEIVVPEPSLVVLCGAAASGKSSFARKHFADTEIVSSDRCRALLWDDESAQPGSHYAFELMHFLVDRRLSFRRTTVADSTALAPDARKALRDIASARRVACIAIAFEVPLEELVRRNATRSRKVDRAVLEEHAARFVQAKERLPLEGYDRMWILGPGDQAAVRRQPASP